MKKLLLTVVLTLMVITASFHAQIIQWIHPQKAISKNIHLTLSSENNYGHQVYANSSAQLGITVIKLHGRKIDTLLVKEYPEFKLKNLSALSKKFNETISVLDVADNKEQIIVSYSITYKSQGSILKIKSVKWVDKRVTDDQVMIHV